MMIKYNNEPCLFNYQTNNQSGPMKMFKCVYLQFKNFEYEDELQSLLIIVVEDHCRKDDAISELDGKLVMIFDRHSTMMPVNLQVASEVILGSSFSFSFPILKVNLNKFLLIVRSLAIGLALLVGINTLR